MLFIFYLKTRKRNINGIASAILLMVLLLLTNTGYGQNIKFSVINTKDGLSSNTVNAILKDRTGLLWVATQEGLNSFDGQHFKVYGLTLPGSKSYQAKEVQTLHEDKKGRLWAGTMGGALYLYDRLADKFDEFPGGIKTKGPNLASNVKSVCSDYQGNIWLATLDGVKVLNPDKKVIKRFVPESHETGGLASKNILYVFEDSSRRMWIGTDKGLYLYIRESNLFREYRHADNDMRSLPADTVNVVAEDKSGKIWIGTSSGLSCLQADNATFKNFKYSSADKQSISGDIIYAIAAENKEVLWVGSEGGLDLLDLKTGKFSRYQHNGRDRFSINVKSIRSIYIDPAGIFWIGTYEGGLNKYDRNMTLFDVKKNSEFDPYGLNAPFVSSVAEKSDHEVYIGTDGGGLSVFDLNSGLFRHVDIKTKQKLNAAGLPIICMIKDHLGMLWIGTYQHGLINYNTKTGQYDQLIAGSEKNTINNNQIFCLKEDHAGNIWIGTNGSGINIFNRRLNKFWRLNPAPSADGDMLLPVNGYIRAIEEDKRGNIWLGTYGGGIAVFDPSAKSFKLYNSSTVGLPMDKVFSIIKDHEDNIWIGTGGDGLIRYELDGHKFKRFSERDGLSNGFIHKILEDDNGNIWVSTNKGLSKLDKRTAKFTNYSQANGLQNNAFVNGAGTKTNSGLLFFGGIEGFNYFKPEVSIKRNSWVPPVTFTSLEINNQPVSPGKEEALRENIATAKEIKLRYKQNFSIGFVALNYTLPQQNKYAYMLKGFDSTWNYVGAETKASYTNLDPGEYVFTVKASNNDGVWNNKGKSIRVIIMPPIWMTGYAYALYLAIILLTLFFIRKQGIKRVTKKLQLVHERKETERRDELNAMKIKFLTNLSHEFRTPISLILSPAEKLLSQQKADGQTSYQLNVIRRNARRLLNLVNQLLDFRKMEENELKLHLNDGEFNSFVKEVSDSFWDMAESKSISLIFTGFENKLYVRFDGDKIERILFNLLSNAFKFTPRGGKIEMKIACDPEISDSSRLNVALIVSDTGSGMSEEDRSRVFERFYQGRESAQVLNQGTGIGLSITREFVLIHNGQITVDSEPGIGTTFKVTLPLERSLPAGEDLRSVPIPEMSHSKPAVNITEKLRDSNLPHVLIVEDNDEFRYYLKDSLAPYYKISEASNGKEGWSKALSAHPDLIVTDITMPAMDGIELSKKLKADKRTGHIPIILLTAMTGEEQQLTGLESGASDYLTKPFNFDILNVKIKNLLLLNETFKNTYSKQIKVSSPDVEIESSDEKFLKNIAVYIEQNLNNPKFSVEDMSRHFGMSRGALYSKILGLTGESPVEFIRSFKLDRAVILLEKSDLNISQIAYSTGFATPHYFTKAFKTKFGCLPSEYKSNKRQHPAGVVEKM